MKVLNYLLAILLIGFLSGCKKETKDAPDIIESGKIMFLSHRNVISSGFNLYIMNKDGSNQFQLSEKLVTYGKPSVSHSGKTILFSHYNDNSVIELYAIEIDGTNLTLIDNALYTCGSPDWSYDDTKIVYEKNHNGLNTDIDIYLHDLLSNNTVALTNSGINVRPMFIKGDKILYCHKEDDDTFSIYTMNLDGTDKQMILADAWGPSISTDGNKIAWISHREQNSSQIFSSNIDGTNQQQLTESFLPNWDSGFPAFGNYGPKWSPDDEKIVYVSEIDDGLPEIYIMNADGSDQIRLTYSILRNVEPIITSDGKYIFFASNRDMSLDYDIYKMTVKGENQTSISNHAGMDIFPIELN